jgi:acyl-CoA thioester hydrolase
LYQNFTKLRVRYAETDQMGIAYYGAYNQYFEVGRVEALRSLNMSYRQMEEEGIMLPVRKVEIEYLKGAKYDDLLTIISRIEVFPTVRISFSHEIYNPEGELLTLGKVDLVFVSKKNRRPCKPPAEFIEKISPFFKSE